MIAGDEFAAADCVWSRAYRVSGSNVDLVSDLNRTFDFGTLANYLADQLGELFAPTPPEVREAQAKADAKAERPARDEKAAAYDAIIESAGRALAEERERTKGDAWWKERDRGKRFERDQ